MSPRHRVGELRPSQLMSMYGIGAVIDLPRMSVILMGLNDWPLAEMKTIDEERLLRAVQSRLPLVQTLKAPPIAADTSQTGFLTQPALTGVPVATFPRWLVCPRCRQLASIDSEVFKLDPDDRRPDRATFRHTGCPEWNGAGRAPEAVPTRFLAMCETGHLDDFPWMEYVHGSATCPSGEPRLFFYEFGPTGQVRDLTVKCTGCGTSRPLTLATATALARRENLPMCTGRRPHLRDYDSEPCENRIRAVALGASNMWFPIALSVISVPTPAEDLAQRVAENWGQAQYAVTVEAARALIQAGVLSALSSYAPEAIVTAVQTERERRSGAVLSVAPEIRNPEWAVFSQAPPFPNGADFQVRLANVPASLGGVLERVVLVDRLRVVRAMIGFTRVDSPGEVIEIEQMPEAKVAPLSRDQATWVPASETRGEGVFLQFKESAIQAWLSRPAVKAQAEVYAESYAANLAARKLDPERQPTLGMRYLLLHSFSHALMRQVTLECGYTAASLSERIYAVDEGDEGEPQAGLLIYTAAPDSEGTLGGLVSLGEAKMLEPLVAQALESMRLCASDPLCAEHEPGGDSAQLHGAACHACLLAPETSCERGNRFLDRAVLVETISQDRLGFFG